MQPITVQKQTIASKSNPLDNSFTGISPCKSCPRINKDKSVCVESCERIMAYTVGQPFEHLPCVEIPVVKIIPTNEITAAVQENKGKCLIPGCPNDAVNRGLCPSHYNSWFCHRILHPILGRWVKAARGKRGKYRKRRKR